MEKNAKEDFMILVFFIICLKVVLVFPRAQMIFDERKNKISLAQDPNIESAPNSGGVNNILVRYNPDSQIILQISRPQLRMIFWFNTMQFHVNHFQDHNNDQKFYNYQIQIIAAKKDKTLSYHAMFNHAKM